jgi:tripartite-type tricarboxylate transporter receptor subunit TctC
MQRRVFISLALTLPVGAVLGQSWPSRPIRVLVGFPPGGTTDILARLLQAPVAASLGQPLVVENKPGAGGLTSTVELVRATPDGHTIAFVVSTHASARALYANVPFDPVADIAPVALIGTLPLVLVVGAASELRSFEEFLAAARRRPGQISYASPGIGLAQHFSGELLKQRAGIDMAHVPYRGAAPAMNDLLGGQIEAGFVALPAALPFVRAQRLRPLAVTSATRADVLPDVPTVAESGFPGYAVTEWYGVVAPSGTPSHVVDRLSAVIHRALDTPELTRWAVENGVERGRLTPEQFREFLGREVEKLGSIARASGMRAE